MAKANWKKVEADPRYLANLQGRALFTKKLTKLMATDRPCPSAKKIGAAAGLLSKGAQLYKQFGAIVKKYEG